MSESEQEARERREKAGSGRTLTMEAFTAGAEYGEAHATQQAEGRIAALEEALAFYADPDTYFAIGFMADPPCGAFVDDASEVDGYPRPGKRARTALAALEGKP